jgi:hypothetical protein
MLNTKILEELNKVYGSGYLKWRAENIRSRIRAGQFISEEQYNAAVQEVYDIERYLEAHDQARLA